MLHAKHSAAASLMPSLASSSYPATPHISITASSHRPPRRSRTSSSSRRLCALLPARRLGASRHASGGHRVSARQVRRHLHLGQHMREVGQPAHQTLAPAPLDRLAPLHLQPQLLQVTQQDPPLPFGSWQSILLRFRSILKPRLTIAEPHSVLAQHIADGCRWACEAELARA